MAKTAIRILLVLGCFLFLASAAAPPGAAGETGVAPDQGWWSGVQETLRDSEYHVTWQEASSLDDSSMAWQAPNRAQGFRTYFTEAGIRVVPRDRSSAGWEWGLSLAGFSRGGEWIEPLSAAPAPVENKVEYRRGGVLEWYVNGPQGLKQAFSLDRPPLDDSRDTELLGIDLALSGTLIPRLSADRRSVTFEPPRGVPVLHYSGLRVLDATGQELTAWMEGCSVDGSNGLRLVIDDREAIYPLFVDPLATTPAWTYDGDQVDSQLGFSVATAGDVDGDGYSDVIVGAYGYDAGQANEGRAYLFHGSASGLSATPDWQTEGDEEGANLGHSVATAGDVNGDGYSDVIVGAPFADGDHPDTGVVHVFHGSSTGLSAGPNWSHSAGDEEDRFGYAVATAGDVNCDGYSDIIVGAPYAHDGSFSALFEGKAYVFHGGPSGLDAFAAWSAVGTAPQGSLGYAVGTTGRTGGGECDGVIVGEPGRDIVDRFYAGGARVYYGHAGSGLSTTEDWFLYGTETSDSCGTAVGTAGDVNGDGYADVMVATPGADGPTLPSLGLVELFHGGPAGLSSAGSPDWAKLGPAWSNHFASSVGTAGDVNGDGYGDVAIGHDEASRATVYIGSETGLGTDPYAVLEPGVTNNDFGRSAATAGDVDGDGYSDLIIGAPGYDDDLVNEGRAFVYYGSPDGVVESPSWGQKGNQAGAEMGFSVASAGDVNGDGIFDVVVGAPQYDRGQVDEGLVLVFHGSTSGLGTSSDWDADGDQDRAYFGHSVASVGDVDGDGYGDLLVGGWGYDEGQPDEGAAWLYHGSSTGLDLGGARPAGSPYNADWEGQPDQASAHYGYAVAFAGDVNGDGYTDVAIGAPLYDGGDSDAGSVFVYHGSRDGLSTSADWIADCEETAAEFGSAVASAGDVNGDGYSDLVVGAYRYSHPEAEEGGLFVFHGSSTGLDLNGTRPSGAGYNADWSAESDEAGAWLGNSVAAGDVNGDGYSDVVAGAPHANDPDYGRVTVWYGSSSGLSPFVGYYADGEQFESQFGYSVACAGDVNGDGYADFVAGAPAYDGGLTDSGKARMFRGTALGPGFGAHLYADVEYQGSRFGHSVAAAGDVNGDGFADVLIGAPGYQESYSDEGKAFLFLGGGGPGYAHRAKQTRVDLPAMIHLLGKSDMENRLRTEMFGRPATGRGEIGLETEFKPLGQPFDGESTITPLIYSDSEYAGAWIVRTSGGLTPGTPYHWRARFCYEPASVPFLPHSRWVSIPWNGWEETDFRTALCVDGDSDGYGFPADESCPEGLVADCDDSDGDVYPGAPQLCDGVNNDCDDPEWPSVTREEQDLDSDGVFPCDGDCDDGNPAAHAGAFEMCDGVDNDCDGLLDAGCDGGCDTPGKIGSDVQISDAALDSNRSSLVATADGYAVAWQDYRDGNAEIYFARLDESGAKLGSELRLTDDASASTFPALVWNGTGFGVAWQDERDGNPEIYFARIDSSGAKVGSDVRITSDAAESREASLAWTGTDYGIAWHDNRDGVWEIYFARLDSWGAKIGSDVRITNDPANCLEASLLWNGSAYGLAWRDKRDGNYEVYFVRLDESGAKIGSDSRITSDVSYSAWPSLVWTGAEYGVAWHDNRDTEWEIYFARIDASGTKLGVDTRASTEDGFHSWYPSLAWTGAEYAVVWYDERENQEIYVVRLDASGVAASPETRVTDDPYVSRYASLAWTGGELGVAWTDYRDGNGEIYLARIGCCVDADLDGYDTCSGDTNDADPTVNPDSLEFCDGTDNDGDGFMDELCDTQCDDPQDSVSDIAVTGEATDETSPDLVWNGSGYGVVWSDTRSGSEIYFRLLHSTAYSAGTELRISDGVAGNAGKPSLAWTGSGYGVAWQDDRNGAFEIYFALLDAEGGKIGADQRVADSSPGSALDASLVWTGTQFGVAWTDSREGHNEIYFARLDPSGNRIGPDLRVSDGDGLSSHSPSLVWTGSEFGLVWSDQRNGARDLYFDRLDARGNRIGPNTRITDLAAGDLIASLVWTGTEYGVAWQGSDEGNVQGILFTRFDEMGTRLGPYVRLSDGVDLSVYASLVWTGTEYGVAWEESAAHEILFARVDPGGTRIGDTVRLSTEAHPAGTPSLAWTGAEYAVAWRDTRYLNESIYISRLFCCDDVDSDGWSECAVYPDDADPNDADPYVTPNAGEICDGRHNNGNGALDEQCDGLCDDPEVRTEVRLTTDSGSSAWPSVAWTGLEYGVAWNDDADGDYDVYFTRLDAAGNPVGGALNVTDQTDDAGMPSVVWTGAEYGLAWMDYRHGAPEIYFARLDESGTKIGAEVRVTRSGVWAGRPSLVWARNQYGLVWEDERDGNREIYFARLDHEGNKLGRDMRLSHADGHSSAPSLTWGGYFGVAWQDSRNGGFEIYFALLTDTGAIYDTDLRVDVGTQAMNPSLAWSGIEGYGLAWEHFDDPSYSARFTRLDPYGAPIGSPLELTDGSTNALDPGLVWNGTEWTVAWNDSRSGDTEVYLARIDTSANRVGADLRVTAAPGNAWGVFPLWNGYGHAVAWSDARDGNDEIYFARVRCCDDADSDGWSECAGDDNDRDPGIHPDATELCDGRDNDADGELDEGCDLSCDAPQAVGEDLRITDQIASSSVPSLAWTGSEYGVAWYDNRDGNWEIYFTGLDAAGVPSGLETRVTTADGSSIDPSLVWIGSEYGFSWRDERDGVWDTFFGRVDGSGAMIGDEVRVTDDPAQTHRPSLAWSGSEYGLAWPDLRDGNWNIYFARLDAGGHRLGGLVQLTEHTGHSTQPSIAWNGEGYGVAFRDTRDAGWEIFFVRLDALGNKLGPEVQISDTGVESDDPHLVWTGTEYGLAWHDLNDGQYEIQFARLDAGGTMLGPVLPVTGDDAADSKSPALTWNGGEYGISWFDLRDGDEEIYFARIDAAGVAVTDTVRLTDSAGYGRFPSLVWNGTEQAVAWTDYRDGNWEIYFNRLACCDDADSDSWSECDECDDGNPDINPGAEELCDEVDNNCDGSIDEGFPTPGVTGGLLIGADKQTLSWSAEPDAERYDVVKGDLGLLLSGGDFGSSLIDCLEPDGPDLEASDSGSPSSGGGFYYLVRAERDCKSGSYDSGGPGQSGNRDPGIAASGLACP